MDLLAVWNEVLGDSADSDLSFMENGGDSFLAVLLSTRAFELWQVEIDYLDVLESQNAAALQELLAQAGSAVGPVGQGADKASI
ncbi:hypothetical protein KV557_22710 [Kitasatospora aureofaciens]|uniref:hypothetical protein n=1 Tax=Kitasatospora aureofaciens TaxID=1894 RepID=UPI001C4737EC|nr:hypothetical protein [Kitasatospora aureofaciens]MBV6699876.1 hypothetical protein [Kitasatospora aureofaciens]